MGKLLAQDTIGRRMAGADMRSDDEGPSENGNQLNVKRRTGAGS